MTVRTGTSPIHTAIVHPLETELGRFTRHREERHSARGNIHLPVIIAVAMRGGERNRDAGPL